MWRPIANADVLEEFTPIEQQVLNNIQGGTNNLAKIISDVVGEAYGAIIAGGNQVDAGGANVPDQLRQGIIAACVWNWVKSIGQAKTMQTDARRQAAKDAQARLDQVSVGKIKIEIPANPSTTARAPVGAATTVRPGIRVNREQFGKFGET